MDFKENDPIFMQIAYRIEGEVLEGVYTENQRMPSIRDYSALVEVNPNTVVRTYDYLQNKGIIYNKRGMGYFLAEGAKEMVTKARREAFLNEKLPELFKAMESLGISFDDIAGIYEQFKKESK